MWRTESDVLKRKKELIKRVERFTQHKPGACLDDKIVVAARGIAEINRYLDLMDTVQYVGSKESSLKVPFRYEIITILYAMMAVSGRYSIEDLMGPKEHEKEDWEQIVYIDEEYLEKLVEIMKEHWTWKRRKVIENKYRNRKNRDGKLKELAELEEQEK